MKRYIKIGILAGLLMSAQAFAASGASVIVRCQGGCDAAIEQITTAGGSITYQYKYVDALAASVPFEHYGAIGGWSGVAHVWKDIEIEAPSATETLDLGDAYDVLDAVALEVIPDDYFESVLATGVGPLHADGHLGDGIQVVVIDSGTAPVSAFSRAGCSVDDPTVIGGETFIAGADPTEPSATSLFNGPHGTQVGTQIAANTLFGFSTAGVLAQSVLTHSPAGAIPEIVPGVTAIPMVGTAPCARIYALKTFRAAGGGAPRSDIAAAMERAIELRENFNQGMPTTPVSGSGTAEDPYVYDALKIDVVNMSLGGPTLFAGFEITDQLTEKMLDVGITVVNSAGNSGHAAMTGGSAGTGFGTLTAGAASLTHNERILRDVQFGIGTGSLYRPADHHQVASFSSRGPTADGRIGVDAVANGFANFAQNPNGGLSLVSGTSFSAPTIAGAAAVLHGAEPGAGGLLVRNALVQTADPEFLGDDSAPIDRGQGFIRTDAALAALQAGSVGTDLPSGPESNSVRGNIASAGFQVIQLGNRGYSTALQDLLPGQVAHFFIQTNSRTDALEIGLSNVMPELPPGEQNAFFGDDLFVVVQDAITSTGSTLASGFINADTTLVANSPQAGLVRVAVMGDWTNAGRISADLDIHAIRGKSPKRFAHGRLQEGEDRMLTVQVPEQATTATFELRWQQDWGAYPTDDLDLIVIDPQGDLVIEIGPSGPFLPGATLNSPEKVVINNPMAGEYTVLIQGFTVWDDRGSRAHYTFYAYDQDETTF